MQPATKPTGVFAFTRNCAAKIFWLAASALRASSKAGGVDARVRHRFRVTDTKIALHVIQPGKPTQNAKVESLNGRVRDELVNPNIFRTIGEVRAAADAWRAYCNDGSNCGADRGVITWQMPILVSEKRGHLLR